MKPIVLIMAGGSGTRFWPLSSPKNPKQFLTLSGNESFFQQTISRVTPLTEIANVYVCCLESHKELAQKQVPELKDNFIIEPMARNTACCVLLSMLELCEKDIPKETPVIVLPADHHISNPDRLREILSIATEFCTNNEALITLGIKPRFPHTGYGYIEIDSSEKVDTPAVLPAKRFLEKPDLATAKQFLAAGNCFWNSGMFIWSLQSIEKAFKAHMPKTWEDIEKAKKEGILKKIYATFEAEPIDKAILEKSDNVFVIPADLQWNDVGSWNAVHELHSPNSGKENVSTVSHVHEIESNGCLIWGPEELEVALVGVDNLIIVKEGDKLLICQRDKDQLVKKIPPSLK